jgi:hypothetical protein
MEEQRDTVGAAGIRDDGDVIDGRAEDHDVTARFMALDHVPS